ncbi:MAG: phage major capsid protein [Acidimicrobiia bacterium]
MPQTGCFSEAARLGWTEPWCLCHRDGPRPVAIPHPVLVGHAARNLHNLEDGDGRSLWTPSLSADRADQLIGRPVVVDPNMPAAGSAATSIAIADFSRAFMIRDVGNVRIDVSSSCAFDQDLLTYRVLGRYDSRNIVADAIRVYVGP